MGAGQRARLTQTAAAWGNPSGIRARGLARLGHQVVCSCVQQFYEHSL